MSDKVKSLKTKFGLGRAIQAVWTRIKTGVYPSALVVTFFSIILLLGYFGIVASDWFVSIMGIENAYNTPPWGLRKIYFVRIFIELVLFLLLLSCYGIFVSAASSVERKAGDSNEIESRSNLKTTASIIALSFSIFVLGPFYWKLSNRIGAWASVQWHLSWPPTSWTAPIYLLIVVCTLVSWLVATFVTEVFTLFLVRLALPDYSSQVESGDIETSQTES